MIRIAGVLTLLIILYATLNYSHPNAMSQSNLIDVANRQGFYGVLTLGVAVLIITGAIDLSIGSVVGLSAIGFGILMQKGYHPMLAMLIVLTGGVIIGLVHGLLVTRLKLQAFLVTLCGMFIYRGIARYLTNNTVGLAGIMRENPSFKDPIDFLEKWLIGKDGEGVLHYPAMMLLMLLLAVIIGIILHGSVIGRYWYAIGYNEAAARYSGINTDRQRILGFVLCSFLASLGGVLMFLDTRSADPNSAGEFMELYAITGAVLGGCSLKGGEGTAIGIVLGAMVLPLLRNVASFQGIKDAIIPMVIGITLLLGTIADEFFRRTASKRKG
jgi:ribose transport system permease protein